MNDTLCPSGRRSNDAAHKSPGSAGSQQVLSFTRIVTFATALIDVYILYHGCGLELRRKPGIRGIRFFGIRLQQLLASFRVSEPNIPYI